MPKLLLDEQRVEAVLEQMGRAAYLHWIWATRWWRGVWTAEPREAREARRAAWAMLAARSGAAEDCVEPGSVLVVSVGGCFL